ncbi:hypothetical protein VTJ04DRAFT_7136 [Mycothermus thermophilus]|uniref:uncharacterized protein n=1 Tax=Humicola insolens TaxID=85995 RepID=UPI00374300F1
MANPAPLSAIAHQLQTSLSATTTPLPSMAWLHSLLSTRPQPLPPLASLLATCRARLLAADLTAKDLLDERWVASHSFPPRLAEVQTGSGNGNGSIPSGGRGGTKGAGAGPVIPGGMTPGREGKLPHDVVVQVLDIQDISRPRWEQVEQLEALARGEGTRGREVIRLPVNSTLDDDDDDDDDTTGGDQPGRAGNDNNNNNDDDDDEPSTYTLTLQDPLGQTLRALTLRPHPRIGLPPTTHIGEKLLLRAGTIVSRGVAMLDPQTCVVLGGKVDVWQRAWEEGRVARLREAVGAPPPPPAETGTSAGGGAAPGSGVNGGGNAR